MNFTQARPLLTQAVVDVYMEKIGVKGFGRSFFPDVFNPTKLAKIEVQRGTEFVAVAVLRNSEGNANNLTKSTEKTFLPPYFSEWTPLNDNDVYDRLIGGRADSADLAYLARKAGEDLAQLRDKIERAYELQTWKIFKNGIVSTKNGDIDYKRNAGSMVDLGGAAYWTQSGANPIKDLTDGCHYLRTKGKAAGGVVNAIMGSKALDAFINNEKVQKIGDLRNISIISISEAQRQANGATLHGMVTCGAWNVVIWSYPEYYEVIEGGQKVSKPYLDVNDVILLPERPRFTMSYNLCPQVVVNADFAPQTGAYLIRESINPDQKAHKMFIESAGLAIPTAVDQIYTIKATNVSNS